MSEPNQHRGSPVEYRGTGFYLGVAGIVVFSILLLILAAQNTQDVTVSFLGWDFTTPLFGVAIGAGLVVLILDELVGLLWRRRRRAHLAERAELTRLRRAAAHDTSVDVSGAEATSPEESTDVPADAVPPQDQEDIEAADSPETGDHPNGSV